MPDAEELLELACLAARAAGDVLLRTFRRPVTGVDTKTTPTDLVSDADRAAEAAIFDVLRQARPKDAILGEESGAAAGTSGVRWIVDPLDGTVNYLYGLREWCVSIAAHDDAGTALAAVVAAPVHDEMYTAVRGGGAQCNGVPLQVSAKADLATALIATGFAYDPGVRTMQAAQLAEILGLIRDIRRGGSAALDLCGVAAGRFDGYYEVATNLWDYAAGVQLVTEAGGTWRTLLAPGRDDVHGVVAAGPGLVDALDALVSGSSP